jgi:hypothetical protein
LYRAFTKNDQVISFVHYTYHHILPMAYVCHKPNENSFDPSPPTRTAHKDENDIHKLYIIKEEKTATMPPLEKKQNNSSLSTPPRGKGTTQMRNEVESLRNSLCELQIRLEHVEDERNYNAAKANELQSLVDTQKKDSIIDDLVQKSLKVAEMSMSIDKLNAMIKTLVAENHKLRTERHDEAKQMEKMSGLVRSLQYESGDDDDDNDDVEVVLTPEKALDMTMKNMKIYLEVLEDDREQLAMKREDQEKKIASLGNDNELLEVKLEMLEELFRSLNQQHIDESPPTQEKAVKEVKKNKSLPDLFANMRRKSKAAEMPETPKNAQWPKAKPKLLVGVAPMPDLSTNKEIIEPPASPNKTASSKHTSLIPALKKANSTPELTSPSARMTVRERRAAAKRSAGAKNETEANPSGTTNSVPKKNVEHRKWGGRRIIRVGDRDGSYVGAMKNGLPNGTGTIRFSNGDTFLGQVVDGKMHGQGTFYHSSRELGIVRGRWHNNEKVEE